MTNDSKLIPKPSNVMVHLLGSQTTPEGIKDSNEAKEEGKIYERGGFYFVVTPNTRYKFNHRFLEVIKNGDIATKIHFEAGRNHTSLYDTPAGSFNFLFKTFRYSFTLNQTCWNIEADYEIQERNVRISSNQIKISISLT